MRSDSLSSGSAPPENQFDYGSFIANMRPDIVDHWMRTRTDGVRMVQALLDLLADVEPSIHPRCAPLEWCRLLSARLHTGMTHEACAGVGLGAFYTPEVAVVDLDSR